MKLIFPNYQKRVQLKSVVPLSNQGSTHGLLLESTRRKKLVPLIPMSVKGWSLPGSLIAGTFAPIKSPGPGIGIET